MPNSIKLPSKSGIIGPSIAGFRHHIIAVDRLFWDPPSVGLFLRVSGFDLGQGCRARMTLH
jgi:hypothetical protein